MYVVKMIHIAILNSDKLYMKKKGELDRLINKKLRNIS